jgi:hypothetical protein
VRQRLDTETKERIARSVARYHAVRRESERILPSDLVMIAQGNAPTRAALRPRVADAAQELADLAQGLGGLEHLSEQRRVLLEDVTRVGLLTLPASAVLATKSPKPQAA